MADLRGVTDGGWSSDPVMVPRRPMRGRAIVIALVALVILSGSVAAWAGWRPLFGPPAAKPEVGLFVGGESVSGIGALGAELGVQPQIMTVYAFGPSYTKFTGPTDTPLRLLLGVGAVTPAQATAIGDTLVATGHANTILRIMWEMNGDWFPWGTKSMSASRYISVFRAAERAFAAVPGNHFEYVWNVNVGTIEPGRTEFDTYPGNAYVSNVGMDFYDYNGAIGAGAQDSAVAPVLAFAARHHRPTSIDEWGVDGKDDAAYIDFVSQLVHSSQNHVQFQAYFSYGRSSIAKYPAARAEYAKDFASDSPAHRDSSTVRS